MVIVQRCCKFCLKKYFGEQLTGLCDDVLDRNETTTRVGRGKKLELEKIFWRALQEQKKVDIVSEQKFEFLRFKLGITLYALKYLQKPSNA